MLQDQQSTLFPDPPTAFASYEDVIQRLLPYHIWQMYDEEMDGADNNPKERDRISAGGRTDCFPSSLSSSYCVSLLLSGADSQNFLWGSAVLRAVTIGRWVKAETALAETKEVQSLVDRIDKVQERFYDTRRQEGAVSPP